MLLVSNSSCDPIYTNERQHWAQTRKKHLFVSDTWPTASWSSNVHPLHSGTTQPFSSSTTLGFLAASPAITTPRSHRVLVHVVASFGLLRFQNPSVAALATNRFGRDIPGTNDSDFVSFCSLSKKGQDLKGLKKSQESQNAVRSN